MKLFHGAVVVGLLGTVLAGCTRSLPLFSHAHVGHTLTAWRDTPKQQGLFVIAEKESHIAVRESEMALHAKYTPSLARKHLRNVTNALNHDIQPQGTGLGYGAIRALKGSLHHIGYAAETNDASANIVSSAAVFSEHATSLLDRLQVVLDLAQLAEEVPDSGFDRWVEEIHPLLNDCIDGKDIDGDGVIGNIPEESGLTQLRGQLSTMISNEKPPYNPIGRQYLLGLVRLPNGNWEYRFDRSGYDGGGYDGGIRIAVDGY